MKKFMGKNFLLTNETAKKLYHEHAAKMPIIDYHCHINPEEIASNRKFDNISQVWLAGDHYKWRAIRSNGVEEPFITGNASDKEKFEKWAQTLPKAIGNPLYHWTHLELKNYFHYDGVLNEKTCDKVWDLCNRQLKDDCLSVRGMIDQSNVKLICTTDGPFDDLKYHKQIAEDPTCKVKVLPAFRPDCIVNIENPNYDKLMTALSEVAQMPITNVKELYAALESRISYFDSFGCRLSDHGLTYVVFAPATEKEVEDIFAKAMRREALTQLETEQFKTAILLFFGREYAKRGWAMQIHYGVLRSNNTKMKQAVGPDTGFDCVGDFSCAQELQKLLDTLNSADALPKTILYSINPNDNAMLATMIGSFQDSTAAGKIQHGAAWWFNDTKMGMEQHMENLASLSLLGNFIGMLTDSRSFLSYARHEYFRRILCNYIGTLVENGEYPNDMETLGQMVEDISYNNAVRYFGFEID